MDRNDLLYEEIKKKYGRSYAKIFTSFEIIKESYKNYLRAKKEWEECNEKENNFILGEYPDITYEEAKKRSLTTISIISASVLEAIILDYAARYFENNNSQNKAKKLTKHVDRLNLPGKWFFIPKIVNNKDISYNSKAFTLLEKLQKFRNDLVHIQTYKLPPTRTQLHEKTKKQKNKSLEIEEVLECIKLLLEKLKEIDDTDYPLIKEKVFDNFIDKLNEYK